MTFAPPGWELLLFHAVLASALGLIGRLMYFANQPSRPVTFAMLWELPVAIGMGLIGRGIGEVLRFDGFMLFAASIIAGFIGPQAITWAAAFYANKISNR